MNQSPQMDSPAELTKEQVRERFEAWARSDGYTVQSMHRLGEGYRGTYVQILWKGWLACARDAGLVRGE